MSYQPHPGQDRIVKLFREGAGFAAKGQFREALKCFDKVLAVAPNLPDAINNRGNCLSLLGRHAEAVACYDKLLAARPDDPRARTNRANALKQLGRFEEAIADYGRALALAPNHVDALYNRGNAFIDIGRPQDAIRDLRAALSLQPNDPGIHTSLIFALNFDTGATAESLQAERAKWAAPFARFLPTARHANEPDRDRKLRIGYVSSHFRHQAATYSFGGAIVHHDPEQFEIFCYSDTAQEDDVSERLRKRADTWHRTIQRSDDELAELIRKDRIDILVDLVGHMRGHRLAVFARKPAPLQVTAWGEPTGTGLRAIDYLFADKTVVPDAERGLLAEEVIDLPNFIGFWSPDALPHPGPVPAVERGYVTFGSFNRLAKIIDPVVRLWSKVLRAIPSSRLVLKDRPLAPELQHAAIMAVFAEEGISAERVTLLDQAGRTAHFAAYNEIDIALDPFPYGGGMTTLDALWMGVPVITAPGSIISSRIAAASLAAVGLDDFIAKDHDAYVALAVGKAGDLASLADLRATLRGRLAASDIGDPVRYARAVERCYRSMWHRWCDSRANERT
jgi:predicted O-linked N-acetylglucosamine transferase (SPINDLY family)